jgi:hypothetical protein
VSEWPGRWAGRTVVCLASGPSLTAEDCEAVRQSGHLSIAVNTTFRIAPFANVLFAHDPEWWKEYREEVRQTFAGELVSSSRYSTRYDVPSIYAKPWFKPVQNSGAGAVSLAVSAGAATVLMLGYDCQQTDGKTHWHGDHPPSLSNAKTMGSWPEKFAAIAKHAKRQGVRVWNCSRQTELTCFERGDLAELLHS